MGNIKMQDLEKIRNSLRRRITRHNFLYDTAISTANISKMPLSKLSNLERKLKTAQNKVKFERQKTNLLKKASQNNIKINPATIRGAVSLQRARAKVDNAVRRERNFEQKLDGFVKRVREYNRQLKKSENSKRIALRPRNLKELRKYEKGLDQLEKGNLNKAKKHLGLKPLDDIRKETIRRDVREAKAIKGYTYKDRVFYQTSVQEAYHSALPELADLLIKGGESLVLELQAQGFTLIEYSDSFRADREGFEPTEFILSMLEDTVSGLSDFNQSLVYEFLAKYR